MEFCPNEWKGAFSVPFKHPGHPAHLLAGVRKQTERMGMTVERKAVLAGTIAGAAAVVLVAKLVIRQHRFKVACGCLLTCTCNEKKKQISTTNITSITAEPTRVTSAPTTKEAPVEVACCSVAPEPSAAEVVLVEAAAQAPHSPTSAGKKQPDFEP